VLAGVVQYEVGEAIPGSLTWLMFEDLRVRTEPIFLRMDIGEEPAMIDETTL
jgi:hypothetical protein